ncbi:MAG: LTA synthase family protein [Oscillospiraceae bacterium]|nr:LTA synthase family protein [Oscillospiraceae bacterium]
MGIILWIKNKRKNQKDITVLILTQVYVFLLSFFTTFFIFKPHISAENIIETIPRFLVSQCIVLIVCEFLYFITFLPHTPLFIVFTAVTMADIANTAKIGFRNEPIVFTDLLLIGETVNIASQYPLNMQKHLPPLLAVFIIFLIIPVFLKRVKINIKKRIIAGLAAFSVTVLFFAHALISDNSLVEKTAKYAVWNLADEYRQNGFVLGFTLSIKRSLIFAPDDYNKNSVREYAEALGYPENYTAEEPPEILPNVIVIMNETYWDTSNLTGIAFNNDPLESVREILAQTGNPALLAPHLGGGTANIEFEFLTGKNIVYYPPGSMIYHMFITKKHWSLAWYFREFGYSTAAIHPYYGWFWKRSTVYPLLGFENVYFDTDMIHTDKKGRYVSDEAVSKEIISRYELLSGEGRKPVFTFAVTMQNHGPFYARYFGGDALIQILNPTDEHTARTVETFAEGVRYASEAFIYLTKYFAAEPRPTYIIMFGDHAPAAVPDMEDLYAISENPGLSEEELYNRYITPIVIWTNQAGHDFEETAGNIKTVTAQMLNEEIFNITGMPKPAYIKMLENIKKTSRGFTNQYILDENGTAYPSDGFERIGGIYESMKLVQYDATLGKNYFINEFDGSAD